MVVKERSMNWRFLNWDKKSGTRPEILWAELGPYILVTFGIGEFVFKYGLLKIFPVGYTVRKVQMSNTLFPFLIVISKRNGERVGIYRTSYHSVCYVLMMSILYSE
ncbi:hypothetical protein HN51_038964 [Arachis hypogaea]